MNLKNIRWEYVQLTSNEWLMSYFLGLTSRTPKKDERRRQDEDMDKNLWKTVGDEKIYLTTYNKWFETHFLSELGSDSWLWMFEEWE